MLTQFPGCLAHQSKDNSEDLACFLCFCSVANSCLTLCDPTDCCPPGFSVREIFQARKLEWVAISSSNESSQPRDQSCVSCLGRQILSPLSYLGLNIQSPIWFPVTNCIWIFGGLGHNTYAAWLCLSGSFQSCGFCYYYTEGIMPWFFLTHLLCLLPANMHSIEGRNRERGKFWSRSMKSYRNLCWALRSLDYIAQGKSARN